MKPLVYFFIAAIGSALLFSGKTAPREVNASPEIVTPVSPLVNELVQDLAKRSPLCDCKYKCPCPNCTCNVMPEAKPQVSPSSDKPVAATPVLFTQPQPISPKKEAPAAGRWEMRQSCGPGGCSTMRVWVPNAQPAGAVQQQSYGSCGPGGCGVRRGLFGRRR